MDVTPEAFFGTTPVGSAVLSFVVEIIITFILMFVISGASNDHRATYSFDTPPSISFGTTTYDKAENHHLIRFSHGLNDDVLVTFPTLLYSLFKGDTTANDANGNGMRSKNEIDLKKRQYLIKRVMVVAVYMAAVPFEIKKHGGIVVGMTIMLNIFVGGPISGASMNPARSIGPALVKSNYKGIWAYIFGPLIGAISGGFAYNLLKPLPYDIATCSHMGNLRAAAPHTHLVSTLQPSNQAKVKDQCTLERVSLLILGIKGCIDSFVDFNSRITVSNVADSSSELQHEHLDIDVLRNPGQPSVVAGMGASTFIINQGSHLPLAATGVLDFENCRFTPTSDIHPAKSAVNKGITLKVCSSFLPLAASSSHTQPGRRNVPQCVHTGVLQKPAQSLAAPGAVPSTFGINQGSRYENFAEFYDSRQTIMDVGVRLPP
ncbi:Aquaporin-like protein [Artemisia annua]|uniref:Aquaporin-like protein n=1 Tax=Artemisia annua TaxID=35608 RepID=A0A2U1M702_ARTAN|nr:Aquaporin-like protein [Artemisia annua]